MIGAALSVLAGCCKVAWKLVLGIAKKGNHGARRTALTKIADNPNINIKDAMQWAGHRDVKTFIDHYCYSRYSDEQKKAELEKTLNL